MGRTRTSRRSLVRAQFSAVRRRDPQLLPPAIGRSSLSRPRPLPGLQRTLSCQKRKAHALQDEHLPHLLGQREAAPSLAQHDLAPSERRNEGSRRPRPLGSTSHHRHQLKL